MLWVRTLSLIHLGLVFVNPRMKLLHLIGDDPTNESLLLRLGVSKPFAQPQAASVKHSRFIYDIGVLEVQALLWESDLPPSGHQASLLIKKIFVIGSPFAGATELFTSGVSGTLEGL